MEDEKNNKSIIEIDITPDAFCSWFLESLINDDNFLYLPLGASDKTMISVF